ncbi:NDNL2 family protein [Megaselia abdita]
MSSDEDVEMANAEKASDIKNIVKIFLNNCANQMPVKRQHIVQYALNGKSKSFNAAFDVAKQILSQTYGICIYEVSDSKTKQYITVSEFVGFRKEHAKHRRPQMVILMIILSYIYMKGSSITESSLFVFLRSINIDVEADDENSYFGTNLKKMITDTFVKKLYLKKRKEDDSLNKDPSNLYSWGFRAEIEFPKKDVLTEACKLIQKDPRLFVYQYNQAYNIVDEEMSSSQS